MPGLPRWFLLLVLVPGLVLAHDLWLDRDGDLLTMEYGHRGAGHEGPTRVPYTPQHVRRVLCADGEGREAVAEVGREYPVTVRGSCAVTYVLTSSGYWSKTPYGTRNQPRDELQQVIDSWLSYEGVKRVDAWGQAPGQALTEDLELVPLENPLALAPGDKLHLRVTFKGQPRTGVVVAYNGKPRGESGADGLVNVRLRERGPQLIQASFSEPLGSPKADRAVHATALVFDLL